MLLQLSTITQVVHAAPIVYKVTALLNLPMQRNFTVTNMDLLITTQKANFNAAETADANGAVSRSYDVALPDNRNQHVRYTSDNYKRYVTDTTMLEIHSPWPSNKLRLLFLHILLLHHNVLNLSINAFPRTFAILTPSTSPFPCPTETMFSEGPSNIKKLPFHPS